MLTVAVLGEVEARRDGDLLAVPGGKTTQLLARLALEAGARVRADAILEDLWAEPTEANTLHSKVSQLRRALGDTGLVVRVGDSYSLAVPREAVDAWRVVGLADASVAARAADDPASSLKWAREGLALFRGDVLLGRR